LQRRRDIAAAMSRKVRPLRAMIAAPSDELTAPPKAGPGPCRLVGKTLDKPEPFEVSRRGLMAVTGASVAMTVLSRCLMIS
jgi:hypothetical protein